MLCVYLMIVLCVVVMIFWHVYCIHCDLVSNGVAQSRTARGRLKTQQAAARCAAQIEEELQ